MVITPARRNWNWFPQLDSWDLGYVFELQRMKPNYTSLRITGV
jgi:hypothetical protein